MMYGYARVSTAGQAREGNSLEAQEKILREHGADDVYADIFTGGSKINNRPQLTRLLEEIAEGDTLIVTKLDRIARSISDGSRFVDGLLQRKIKVNILNLGLMDDTPASKLIRNIFLSFAEFERDMIRERTQEGKAIARTRNGYKEGRPEKFTQEQIRHALELLEYHTYAEVEEMTRISESTLKRAKRKRTAASLELAVTVSQTSS